MAFNDVLFLCRQMEYLPRITGGDGWVGNKMRHIM